MERDYNEAKMDTKIKRTCRECVKAPENFSRAFQPLSKCYKLGFHVHKIVDHDKNYPSSVGGLVIFKDNARNPRT